MTARLKASSLNLRKPQLRDYRQWKQLREQSSDFLIPWEPTWPEDDLSWNGYRRRLRNYNREVKQGYGLTFFMFSKADGQLLGGLSFANIRYGSMKSCQLGYWMGQPFAGQGYMKEAVICALDLMFTHTAIQRVEAFCLPENAPSEGLLKRLGFRKEGEVRQYMEINGRRRDHLFYAILKEDFIEAYKEQEISDPDSERQHAVFSNAERQPV